MSDEQHQTVSQEKAVAKKVSAWCVVWILLFLILFGVSGIFGYIKWVQLTQQLTELKEAIKGEAKVSLERLQPVDEKLNQLSTMQTTLQTAVQQQDTTLSTWKEAASGNVDRWYVAEARYLVKLAQLEANATSNYLLVNGYLEKAQTVLQKIADPKALEMRTTLKQDQDQALSHAPTRDIAMLFQQLIELDKKIDALPFPLQTMQSTLLQPATSAVAPAQSWWNKGLNESMRLLKEVVVVKKNTDNRVPFLLPDDKEMLKANLHLQLQHAIDGLLRNQTKIYAASLQQAVDWVRRYFKADDALAVAWLKDAAALEQIDLSASLLDISHSVPLFDAYLNQ